MFGPEHAENRVWQALEAYPEDPSGLTDDQSAEGFAQLQRISEAVEAKRLRWLADQDRRASYRKDGYRSSAAWLADRFKVSAGYAKQQVKVAQALEEMPRVRDTFLEGSVTSGAVRVLAAARETSPVAFASDEPALVETAMTRPVEELRRVVGDWSQAMDEKDALERAEALRKRRRLDVCPTPTRMVRVEGELDPEGGEAVLTALQALVDADLRSGGGMDLRTPTQRRADALCELAHRFLQSPDRPTVAGERPPRYADGGRQHPETCWRIREQRPRPIQPLRAGSHGVGQPCDSQAAGLRFNCFANGDGWSVGAIGHRKKDACCIRGTASGRGHSRRPVPVPRLHPPSRMVRRSPRQTLGDGGVTSLYNLVLLCRPHHRLVHEGGFGLETMDGKPVFRRPDGSVIEDMRAPP